VTKNETIVESLLLDEIRKRLGLSTDCALAKWLKVDRTAIYAIRRGKCKISMRQRLKMLDGIGYFGEPKISELLSPRELNQRLLARASPALLRATAPGNYKTEDERLLDVCRRVKKFRKDPQLAEYLQVTRQFLAHVRAGKNCLGIGSRLCILAGTDPQFPIQQVRNTLVAPADQLLVQLGI
jgi:DNA-binding XRE family transcriptional regulator